VVPGGQEGSPARELLLVVVVVVVVVVEEEEGGLLEVLLIWRQCTVSSWGVWQMGPGATSGTFSR
jgi:hypothetical protein